MWLPAKRNKARRYRFGAVVIRPRPGTNVVITGPVPDADAPGAVSDNLVYGQVLQLLLPVRDNDVSEVAQESTPCHFLLVLCFSAGLYKNCQPNIDCQYSSDKAFRLHR